MVYIGLSLFPEKKNFYFFFPNFFYCLSRYIEVFRSSRQEMAYYSSNSQTSRTKQPNKIINKRNSNWNNNNNNNGNDMYKQNSSDFNRNRQKPYSRNNNQNAQYRFKGRLKKKIC